MKEAFGACMNETVIKEIGVQPLVDIIGEVAKRFPVTEKSLGDDDLFAESDHASLSNTVLLLEKWGITTFEGLGAGADDKNPVSFIAAMSYRRWSNQ